MRDAFAKAIAVTLACLLTWFDTAYHATPDSVRMLVMINGLFIFVDTVTGVYVAALRRSVRSRQMRVRLLVKMAQYACILTICGGASLLSRNWFCMLAGLVAVMAFEATSILENMRRMEMAGGINLRPARPLLRFVAHFLDVDDTEQPSGASTRDPDKDPPK